MEESGVDLVFVIAFKKGLWRRQGGDERCRRLVVESASPGLATAAERAARRGVDEARATRLERWS